jgi:hypothetical protein
MRTTIEKTLLGRGNTGDAFWSCVKQKIDEKLCETELLTFYENFRLEHPEEKDKGDNEEEFEYLEPISPILGPASLVSHKLITT